MISFHTIFFLLISWPKHLVGTKNITKGAIFGLTGGKWACSANFKITDKEAAEIVKGFSAGPGSYMIEGHKYMQLRADASSIYGKLGKGGFVAVKTGKAVVIGIYDDPIQPGAAANTVEKLGDYLKEVGY